MSRRGPNPDVEITRGSKRGEWHTFQGVTKDGRKASVDIHAKDLEGRSRVDRDALIRRSLHGQAQQEGRSQVFREPLIRSLAELERLAIVDAMIKLRGNKPAVAEALGISLKTLYNRLHDYGMPLDYAQPVANSSIDATPADALTVSHMR